MSLNSGGNIAQCLYLFFNEHEDRVKIARILHLFFNEHEIYAKTARSYVYFLTSMNYVLKLLYFMFVF